MVQKNILTQRIGCEYTNFICYSSDRNMLFTSWGWSYLFDYHLRQKSEISWCSSTSSWSFVCHMSQRMVCRCGDLVFEVECDGTRLAFATYGPLRVYQGEFFNVIWSKRITKMEFYKLHVNLKLIYCEKVYLLMEISTWLHHIISRHITRSHRLEIEKVRWLNIDTSEQICKLCDVRNVKDEEHVFLILDIYIYILECLIKLLLRIFNIYFNLNLGFLH